MKKSDLRRELAWMRAEHGALTQRVRDLRATNTELVNNFAGEIAQSRYELAAAREELEETRESMQREIHILKRTVAQLKLKEQTA